MSLPGRERTIQRSRKNIERQVSEIPEALEHSRNNLNKKYDFFVLHSDSGRDSDWVYYSLLPKLEKDYHIKGCVKIRDYQLGANIFEQLQVSFSQSVKVLLIVSEQFIKDNWCRYEYRQALFMSCEQDSRKVIPIVLDKNLNIPFEIRLLTPFYVTESCNWERLVKGLGVTDNTVEDPSYYT